MWALLVAVALGAVQAKATPHKAEAAVGELQSVTAEAVVLTTAEGAKTVPLADLKSLEFPGNSPDLNPHDGPVVELIDGSLLPVEDFVTDQGQATISRDAAIAADQKQIQAVLFSSQRNYAQLQAQWRKLIDAPRQGDLLVVRRTRAVDGERVDNSLDQLECIVHKVDEKAVHFSLDGNRREVPRAKLEGVIFFHRQTAELAEPLGELKTADGGVLKTHRLEFKDDRFQVTTRSKLTVPLAGDAILGIRFAGGDTVYLSDLTPQETHWRPFVPTRIGGNRLAKLYAPRMDQANDGGPLRLDPNGPSFEKGISLHSRTELVYRLPDAFRRLQATVGLDPRYRNAGNVELIIKSETNELLRQAITPDKPILELDVDVQGARRLIVIVDFGEGWDVGDFVNLCDVRLIK